MCVYMPLRQIAKIVVNVNINCRKQHGDDTNGKKQIKCICYNVCYIKTPESTPVHSQVVGTSTMTTSLCVTSPEILLL